ncbi:hypothetical protein J2Y69_002235 [Microbacterium resistens]|uniref:ABC transporter permease n=1 Tax=Microbacterium resistens TaxID=156977 RepID=A0ABU1SDE2_9MICO|nr:hypothetical protein [Microbacterium resistens]MDR6867631.1 hypothetical protein [Microbacterium resistens]
MMNDTRRPPRMVVVASVLLGLMAVAALAITAGAVYGTVTAEGMGTLAIPFLILVGLLTLVSGVGCALTIPRVLRGTHRGAATTFVSLALLPALYLAWSGGERLVDYFIAGGDESVYSYTVADLLTWALYTLPLIFGVVAIVLLWAPPSMRAFFAFERGLTSIPRGDTVNDSRRPPRMVKAAFVLLGLTAAAGLAITIVLVYTAITAIEMGTMLVPVYIFGGVLTLVGGVGCAAMIPRVRRGTGRGLSTMFVAFILLPAFYLAQVAVASLIYGGIAGLLGSLYGLPLVLGVVTIVLLWAPPSVRAFFARPSAG